MCHFESIWLKALSFLDITITSKHKKLVTWDYCKYAFSSVFANFESFIPEMNKLGLTETLLHRSFRLCSSYDKFHREIETLKSIFKYSNYPQNFVNQCMKVFWNKLWTAGTVMNLNKLQEANLWKSIIPVSNVTGFLIKFFCLSSTCLYTLLLYLCYK